MNTSTTNDNASTCSNDRIAHTTMDEAGIMSIVSTIEALTRQIEADKRFCRLTAKGLPQNELWESLRRQLLDIANENPDIKFRIVVLGASGVGKSSVLNVILHESNLLPSSATGDACTAVPIEIHFNSDPECADVKAEIQFVTEPEWRRVLKQAKAEIDDEEEDRSDQGHSAVQRVSVVYPTLSEVQISKTPIDDILAANVSGKLLGKCTTLQANDRADFYRNFKQQIGSLKRPGFETWPLIDHVRLYVRHPLLENGLVLVDIPGMFETNRARAENAANYLEKASAVLIMIHAARSKSGASQKSLFGRVVQQMQFDQRLDNVLFVCTKSDEMNARETLNELDVPETQPIRSQLKAHQQDQQTLMDECDTLRLQVQEQEKIANYRGKDVTNWKKAKSKAAGDWNSFKPPKERLADGKFLKAEAHTQVWDEDMVNDKIEHLKQEKARALSRVEQLQTQLAAKESQLQRIEVSIEDVRPKLRQAVFRARNNLIKEHQAQQYLSAVSMYERNSARAVEGIIEPADDETMQFEDLDKVKGKVFCVSALAYSRLSNLKIYDIKEGAEELKDDGNSTDFLKDVEDTEIPALVRRLKHLALMERQVRLHRIQQKFQIAIGALQARLSPNVQRKEIDLEAATRAAQDFDEITLQFRRSFIKHPEVDIAIKKIYKAEFTDTLPKLNSKTIKRASIKIQPYSRHPGDGRSSIGLYAAEYKALVKSTRNGNYTTNRFFEDGSPFVADTNQMLATSIKASTYQLTKEVLVSEAGGIKTSLSQLRRNLEGALNKYHADFRLHAISAGVDLRRVVLVDEQLQLRQRELDQVFLDTRNMVSKAHVTPARQLPTEIESKWKPAYGRAYGKRGNGARLAMSNELIEALTVDNVVGHALNVLDLGTSAEIDEILEDLSDTLNSMASSIAAEYNGYMEHRSRSFESTGDPKLDKIRNRMIASGYEDLELPASDGEGDIPAEMGSGVADPETIITELAKEVEKAGHGEIKVEASDGEATDEEVKDEETSDEEMAEESD